MEMAHEDQTDSNIAPKKAQWNDTETNAFINYLIANRLKMGATSFKLETFNKAASTLEAMDIRTHGPIKTGVHCRNKYNLLKTSFNLINKYCNKSGVHWNAKIGANIQGPTAEEAWSSYLANPTNSGMKQFKNGWRFYPKMEELLSRASTAHGAATYNPSAVSAASATTADDDDGDPEDTLLGPSTSDGPSPSTADVVTSEPISWNIPCLNTEQPVASTSVAVAPPLSSTSSSGKRTFSDMLFECSTAASTSTSQMSDALSDKIILVHAFMRAPAICSMYNQLTQESLHLTFLQSIIEQAKSNFNL